MQSHVTAHAEGAWLLAGVTSYGQLGRMTQFKDKSERQEFVAAGLFTYPILMAADILLYQTDLVPIGDDQRQHLELARDVAERFNSRFGETFRFPAGVFPETGRGSWTCRSRRGRCRRPAARRRGRCCCSTRLRRCARSYAAAVTDSGGEVRRGADKPGVTNLIDIMSVATGASVDAIEKRFDGSGYGRFKDELADAVIERSRRSRSATGRFAATRASFHGCSSSAPRRPPRSRR